MVSPNAKVGTKHQRGSVNHNRGRDRVIQVNFRSQHSEQCMKALANKGVPASAEIVPWKALKDKAGLTSKHEMSGGLIPRPISDRQIHALMFATNCGQIKFGVQGLNWSFIHRNLPSNRGISTTIILLKATLDIMRLMQTSSADSGIETTLIGRTKHFGGGMQNIGSRKILFHLVLCQSRREFDNGSGADAALNNIARHSWN
jgi:hypothetical protein